MVINIIRLLFCLHLAIYVFCLENKSKVNISLPKEIGDFNELVYYDKLEISLNSTLTISIDGYEDNHKGFSIVQVHSFHYNITAVYVENEIKKINQYTTNIGFMIHPDNSSKTLHLENKNHNEVYVIVALIRYSASSPIPSGCFTEANTTTTVIKSLIVNEKDNLLTVRIPAAKESMSITCDDSKLTYETYYSYIDPLNFAAEAYFEQMEKMIYTKMLSSYKAKDFAIRNVHLFERIPGRALIVNVKVVKRKNNTEESFYLPFISYSCSPNTWKSHCVEATFLKRAISVVLVFHSIIMMMNLMKPFMESLMNGMLIGGLMTVIIIKSNELEMQSSDYFVITMIGAFFMCAISGTITFYFPIGRYLTKLIFGNLITVFIAEIFAGNVTSIYFQLLFGFLLSLLFLFTQITFSVLLGSLILILNLSFLSQVGNLHRFVINNFLAITSVPSYSNDAVFSFIRFNYINYRVQLNLIDYALILIYVVSSIFLTIRKEQFYFEHPSALSTESLFSDTSEVNRFNREVGRLRRENGIIGIRYDINGNHINRLTSRCRRQYHNRSNLIHERSPLISHWLTRQSIAEDEEDMSVLLQLPPQSSNFNERLNATHHSDHDHDDDTDLITLLN